jgi:NitT/TauT family transport system permease protein
MPDRYQRPPGRAGVRPALAPLARGTAGAAAVLLLAQAAGWSGLVSRAALPLPSTVLAQAARLAVSARFLADAGATLGAWAAGLGVAVAVAVPAGLLLGSVPGIRSATRALTEFLRPVPPAALIPLVALVIGPGLRMNITLTAYAAAWPLLLNTIRGLDDVHPAAADTLRAFGFGPVGVLARARIPAAAPFILTGVRLASSAALIVSIATGVVTGRIDGAGIGAFIADANASGSDAAVVLAAALWAGVLGLVLNGLLAGAGRLALPWQHAYLRLGHAGPGRGYRAGDEAAP